ncbi:MAG: hypothetical protein KatS3mg054_0157 [Chloroflexus sp.]|nr:MAG: hypothetical protein KatS3mg054_0157 [Chloroflexus sp.]
MNKSTDPGHVASRAVRAILDIIAGRHDELLDSGPKALAEKFESELDGLVTMVRVESAIAELCPSKEGKEAVYAGTRRQAKGIKDVAAAEAAEAYARFCELAQDSPSLSLANELEDKAFEALCTFLMLRAAELTLEAGKSRLRAIAEELFRELHRPYEYD